MNSVDRTDTMRRARILRWASLSAALAACAATLAAVSLTGWSLFQPDTRYMVAIGRWIVENGELPTSDLLTLHEGLAYICQQWPLCIAAAAIFDAFGEAGIRCAAAALDIAATATLWACTLDRGRTGAVHMAASAACGAAIAVLCNSTPRGIDVMALCACYAAGRKWARGGRDSLLAAFPAAGFAMAQLHGALWTVALMVPCCLILDGRLDRHGRLKALTAAMSTAAACMLNPYGARLLMVPFATMSANSLKSVGIGELAPWTEAPAQAAAACTLVSALVLYRLRVRCRGGGRALLEAGDLLVLGTLMLALANVRNELFLMTSMALALSDIQGEVAGPRARRPLALASLCTAALLAAIGCLAATVPAKTAIEESAAGALSSLAAAGAKPGDAVICDIDVGSELELAGYRPLLDTRAELFCPELNGGTDAWGQARSVLTGDAAAIGETGADFAVFPSGAYPALEKALTGLGYADIYDDGCFAAYADRPVSIESAHSEQGRERGKRPIHPIFGKPDDFPGRRVHLLCRTAPERGGNAAVAPTAPPSRERGSRERAHRQAPGHRHMRRLQHEAPRQGGPARAGLHRMGRDRRLHRRRTDRRPGVPVRRDEQQDQHRREHAQEHYRQRRPCRPLGTSDRFPSRRHHNSYI